MSKSDNISFLVVLAAAAVVVASYKWPRIRRVLSVRGSSRWLLTTATVEQVLVHSYSGRSGVWAYRPEVVYSYEVGGEFYSGKYEGELSSSEVEANALAQQYPKGTRLHVRVNPRKPEVSALTLDRA